MERLRRRAVLTGMAGVAATALTRPNIARAAETPKGKPIVVGTIEDLTGVFATYGLPAVDAEKLAAEEINKSGGLLGRPIKLLIRNSQSDIANYPTFANQLILSENIDVLFAGILSSAREAVRPVVDRHKVLYFYTSNYEGGVCDKNVFLTGTTPSQKMKLSIEYMLNKYGKKAFAVLADYNYGHLEGLWLNKYMKELGGTVLQTEYIPLTATNFTTTVGQVERAAPDWIFAATAGNAQLQFYRELAATKKSYGVFAEDFGEGNEQISLPPSAAEGIITAANWVPGLKSEAAIAFTKLWTDTYGSRAHVISDQAVSMWNAWHLWAAAVEKAGTTEESAVIKALESGISYDGPAGRVTMDGPSHHVIEDVSLVRVNADHGFDLMKTVKAAPPTYEQSVCNLIKHPDIKKQFQPEV